MAAIKAISIDASTDTATATKLHRIRELVRDASERVTHVLFIVDARIGSYERRQLENAAQDLRHAMKYFERHTPFATIVESERRK